MITVSIEHHIIGGIIRTGSSTYTHTNKWNVVQTIISLWPRFPLSLPLVSLLFYFSSSS